ncbi:MAG: hypothetical protein N838_22575 [Thiohalocapsa sp. PB-PSB1]|jgi:predicted RNA-binding Zn-ribbon protein involved in translation (DUF1610 family)|nr:MAG: hypothetical protein N838_08120 [Thiohalocapsa sp. PB-PSB1]QQO55720.1 MAG: hypothetical protein N838_22575 [Thiohalocapsa sp. PB-PSB1]
MGEWSEYFADFPEENPANWINGRFDPQAAALSRQREAAFEKADREGNAELRGMISTAKKKIKARSLLVTEDCPQCGLRTLNTYRISKDFFLCECQDCGLYGKGMTHEEALSQTAEALGDGLDWREEGSLF